jgi:hypothetical protein
MRTDVFLLHLADHDGNRFAQAFKEWSLEVVAQCRRRLHSSLPSVEEYIDIRRRAVGQGPVEGQALGISCIHRAYRWEQR